jgi:GrpB-like predicted nucleotidyltransferase (UPF0157 family)
MGGMKKIQVVAYNPKWKLELEKAKAEYEKLLCDVETEILHIGSTCIEGIETTLNEKKPAASNEAADFL